MTCVVFRGLRGGVGTTSTVAGVAHALQGMAGSLLVVDLTPVDLLRWHLGLGGLAEPAAPAPTTESWRDHVEMTEDGCALLRLGRLGGAPGLPDGLRLLASDYDWVLVDAPAAGPASELPAWADLVICTVHADAACAILLADAGAASPARLLVTQYDPLSQLQRDVRLLLQHDYAERMAPTVIHRDTAVAEALARGQAVGAWRGDSVAAQDMQTVATWLLAVCEAPA